MSKKTSIAAVVIAVVSLCTSGVSLGIAAKKSDSRFVESTVQSSQVEQETNASTQYVMYVGTNDKDTYKPEHTQQEAMKIVDEICLKYFDGYTLQEATGSWKDEKDNITHEYTIVCYFDDADEEAVYHVADDVIAALNQNTVLIEKGLVQTEYYSSAKSETEPQESTASDEAGENSSQIEPVVLKENAAVSYLGPAGTYTEEATKLFFGADAVLSPQKTVDDAIANLIAGKRE